MEYPCIAKLNDPNGSLSRLLDELSNTKKGNFTLAIGSTFCSDIDGISAAGATPQLRRLTPATDAEALILGCTADGSSIPVSPAGIVSPVVLTRAALQVLQAPSTIINCGAFKAPNVSHTSFGSQPAQCLSTGSALTLEQTESLFSAGLSYGKQIRDNIDYVILAECVPGGTTTALGVMTALGHKVDNFLSSSLPISNHHLRFDLVTQGLKKSGLTEDAVKKNPLAAVSALGDPMQPFIAGAALSIAEEKPTVLAGGSQMLAVWALMKALIKSDIYKLSLGVITTKWVAFDPSAKSKELSELLGAPFAAVCLDLTKSKHKGLHAYEQGHVKEGMGAGGALAVAHIIKNCSEQNLIAEIDKTYDELVFGIATNRVPIA